MANRLPNDWNSEVFCARVDERITHLEKQANVPKPPNPWYGIGAAILAGLSVYVVEHFLMK